MRPPRPIHVLRTTPWGVLCLSILLVFGGLCAPIRKVPRSPVESAAQAQEFAVASDHNCGCADLSACAGGCCCDPDYEPRAPEEDQGPLFMASCGKPKPGVTGLTRVLLCSQDMAESMILPRPVVGPFEAPQLDPKEHRIAPPTPPPRA